MKTLIIKRIGIILLSFVVLQAFAGCQSAAPIAKIAPTPTEMVIVEKEVNCPLVDFVGGDPLNKVMDPELGSVDRAFVVKWTFTCPEPFFKGKAVAIQDGYYLSDGTYFWIGMYEIVTDEGGVWKMTCENDSKSARCTGNGESKYKGMHVTSELFFSNNNLKFSITKLAQ